MYLFPEHVTTLPGRVHARSRHTFKRFSELWRVHHHPVNPEMKLETLRQKWILLYSLHTQQVFACWLIKYSLRGIYEKLVN